MDANAPEGHQLDARLKAVEERLAKVEEVLTDLDGRICREFKTHLQQNLSICMLKVEKILAYCQSTFALISTGQAKFPTPETSSLPAIASSSSSSSLNILSAFTAADNLPAYSFLATSHSPRVLATSLHEAAEKGDLAALHCFLETGETINAQDYSGNTALHLAVNNGRMEAAEVLIVKGAALDSAGNRRRTPLHCAAAKGDLEMVARLLAAGASVEARDVEGATAVGLAAREGHDSILKSLLHAGASINTTTDSGETPLLMAVKHKGNGAIRFLLRNGVSPTTKNHAGVSPISFASAGDHVDLLEELLEMVPESEKNEIPKSLAVAASAEVVWMISDALQGMDLGSAGEEACIALAREGREEALHAVLQMGVNPNATDSNGVSALSWAMSQGHTQCAKMLKDAGAEVTG